MIKKLVALSWCALALVLLAACVQDLPMTRQMSANNIAGPVFLIPRTIQAGNFSLKAFERNYQRGGTAILYIEGDGTAFVNSKTISPISTPTDPVGLRLAAQDSHDNVFYLARPCQYRGTFMGKKECPNEYWTTHRFAPEVLSSYMIALDNLKAFNEVSGFHIVGYGGGAAIAAILAAQRSDILSLRTVAGNLDHQMMSRIHGTNELTGSLNPLDYATSLASKPQRHFVGKLDRVAPPKVYMSFAQKMGPTSCNAVTLVDKADHEMGWVEQWRVLKDLPTSCSQTQDAGLISTDVPLQINPADLGGQLSVIK
jgi:hypothetical protein